MSRRLRSANVLLERINDIDAECSEDDQEILDMENDNTENYDPFETDSNTDENEENISNVRRRRKRRRFLVSSDSENEEEASEIAMDGTVWQEVKIGSNPGRAPGHNIFRETSGPTGYSKRNILFQLAEELAIEYQQELGKENQPIPIASTNTGSRERKTCQIRYCKDNKTNKICLKCKKYVCGKCTVEKPICKKCDEKE
ncbi:uncharacterized protein LOC126850703 [Cataglyphis hispanica]|uniref:uncharacterized protein LOC126850703 n=1 Tax=Cataglyphis hispanica TaxID=1086592 RepID=UPI0021804D13|nr:uncharacterized protein LOC126850703 [Cataglyphis hispanica]